jgi:hypothetical protein
MVTGNLKKIITVQICQLLVFLNEDTIKKEGHHLAMLAFLFVIREVKIYFVRLSVLIKTIRASIYSIKYHAAHEL